MDKKQFNLEFWQSHFINYILNVDQNFMKLAQPMPGMSAESCAQIYQRGYKARLTEVLGDTFEATWWILGDNLFFELAEEFISNMPSRSYDLSDYGSGFPKYIESKATSLEIPFLPDLTRFEWLFKTVFHEPDIKIEAENILSKLSNNPDLKIKLNNQVHFFSSDYLVYDLWKKRSADVSIISELNWKQSQSLIVFKQQEKIRCVQLSNPELNLLSCFNEPSSLEELVAIYINKYGEFSPDIIQGLFSKIAHYGILVGFNYDD